MKSEKVTKQDAGAAIGWSYHDACGAAHALDLVGERWSLLVMRELMMGPKRFTDLRASLPGISANVLTQRLHKLEAVGVVEHAVLGPPSGRAWRLTPWGEEARPIFMVLGRWAARSPLHDPTLPLTATSLMMSMETMLRPERAAGLAVTVAMAIGAERYTVRVADGTIAVAREAGRDADATLTAAAAPAIAGWLYGGVPLEALAADGSLVAAGDCAALATFRTLFELPPKVTG